MPYTLEDREKYQLPAVEHLSVDWIKMIPPEMIVAYRKLRKTNLLWIYSAQVDVLNKGLCEPGVFCVNESGQPRCQVMQLEDRFTGYGGPLACSLVRAILAVELGFYKRRVAEEDYDCALCGEKIVKGQKYIHVELFGLEPLRICSDCLVEVEEE